MLNAFVHEIRAVVGQGSTGDDKTNEPSLFRWRLRSLPVSHPTFQLIGDAMFAQRRLTKLIRSFGKDYLFQVKGNQRDTIDFLEHYFAKPVARPPAAQIEEKRGLCGNSLAYGWI